MLRRPQTPFGYTIFCDDIREEVGGKTSYIGVYSGAMIVYHPFPVTIAKLAMAIQVMFSPDDERRDLQLKVFGPGPEGEDIVLINSTIPMSDADEVVPGGHGVPMIAITVNVILSPFKIEREGAIRVRLYDGDDEIPMGLLALIYESGDISDEQQNLPAS